MGRAGERSGGCTSVATENAPIERVVTRYICPHCHRGRSSRKAATVHIAQCWRNPGNRSCKTCAWYVPVDINSDEHCTKGITIGKAREQAIEEAWAEYNAAWEDVGGPPKPDEEAPTPFPFNCDLWEADA